MLRSIVAGLRVDDARNQQRKEDQQWLDGNAKLGDEHREQQDQDDVGDVPLKRLLEKDVRRNENRRENDDMEQVPNHDSERASSPLMTR